MLVPSRTLSLTKLDGLLPLFPFGTSAARLEVEQEVGFSGAWWMHKHQGDAKVRICMRRYGAFMGL